MSKIKILSGDLPGSTEFYNNPGSIAGLPVAEAVPADTDSVRQAGMARPFGIGQKVYFLATFDDGRRILAVTDPKTFARLERDIAGGPVSQEAVTTREKANTRTGVLFVVAFGASCLVFQTFLPGYLPFLAAFGVALAVSIAGSKLFPGG